MKITPDRKEAAARLARVPLDASGTAATLPRVTSAYLAAVRGIEAGQSRVGVFAFPGLRFQDASGDAGLAFVHPLALNRVVMLALTERLEEGEEGGPSREATHAYSPAQARALAYSLLVLADEAEADAAEVVG